MPVFTAAFTATSFSTVARDVFEVTAPTNSRVALRKVIIGQYSDFGDAQAELISVSVITGSTVAGSTGAAITPKNVKGWSTASTCGSAVTANNTTLASSGTVRYADTFNVAAGWYYDPPAAERIIFDASERAVIRITAPADALTANGTLIFEELGQGGTGET